MGYNLTPNFLLNDSNATMALFYLNTVAMASEINLIPNYYLTTAKQKDGNDFSSVY